MPFAPGIINNVGLYSKKYKSFAELPEGASVAIANDPINSGRGLQLLAKAGLITLKPGVGYKATEEDIIANPKKIKILQVEAVQLVRAYDDADLVGVIRPTFACRKPSMPARPCCSMVSITRNT